MDINRHKFYMRYQYGAWRISGIVLNVFILFQDCRIAFLFCDVARLCFCIRKLRNMLQIKS